MPQHELDELDAYLRECVQIEPLAIQEEFIRIPADLAYWNARYAKALRRHLMAKVNIDTCRARLVPAVRNAIIEAGGKATEATVEAAVESNEALIEARQEGVEAEVEKNELYGALDAIRSKKEMLISLGAHMRAELDGDPALRDHSRHYNRKEG